MFLLQDLVEIEEWNEYGELKQHVTIFYDDFTQPSISQAPKAPPAAAPKAPPGPPPKTTIERVAATASATTAQVTLPIRSIAEEAAAKAKQVHLQSLRDKVHGKGNTPSASSSPTSPSATAKSPTSATSASSGLAEGLQSPTTSGWKAPADISQSVQSPTTTSWKPRDVDPPVRQLHGASLADASAEEIAAVERAETIKEDSEEENTEEESEEESEEEESSEEEGKGAKKVEAVKGKGQGK